jgi:integrase/recombinase XerD
MTLSIIAQFRAYLLVEKRVSQNTYNAYKRDIDQFLHYLKLHKIQFDHVSISHIKKFLAYLKKKLFLKSVTIARKISSIKALYVYLHNYHKYADIASLVECPKIEKPLPRFLSEQEVRLVLAAAGRDTTPLGNRNKMLLYVLYITGVRISELIKMQVSDIEFDKRLIRVYGKGGKTRMVPIPKFAMKEIKKYLAEHRTNYLFPNVYRGKPNSMTRQGAWLIIKRLCKMAGIDRPISPHQFRHSLATHMLKNGIDLRALQLILGHEKIATVQIYTHVETSHLRNVYDKRHPRS